MAGTFTTRNTPLPAAVDGFQQAEMLAGDSALLSDLFTIPADANSAWIQVPEGALLFRQDGDVIGNEWHTLPALSFLPLTNRQQLLSLVLACGVDVINVGVQFFAGALGPMPPAPEVNTSGSTPPPPPGGLTSLPIENTLHVMKNGNDVTAQRNRLDLPFLTIAAAIAASQTGDTIVVWPGEYQEGDLEVDSCTIQLMGATIFAPGASTNLFLLTTGGSLVVRGTGSLMRDEGGTATPLIFSNLPNARVTLDVDLIENGNGPLFIDDGGSTGSRLEVTADMYCNGGGVSDYAVRGWTHAHLIGDMSVAGIDGAVSVGFGARCMVRGDIVSDLVVLSFSDDGVAEMFGDATSVSGTAITSTTSAQLDLYGAVLANQNGILLVGNDKFKANIHGRIAVTNGAGVRLDGVSKSTTVNIYGNIHSATSHAVWSDGGAVNVWGDLSTEGIILNSNAVLCASGFVYVHGNCSSVAGATVKTQSEGRIEVFGNCYTEQRWAAYCISGGRVIVHGECKSDALEGAFVEKGEITLGGQVIGAAGRAAVLFLTDEHEPGNRLWLLGACRLVGGGTVSIAIQAGGITGATSYGAYANLPVQAPLAVAGTLNILP